jgi:alginate O-acetyltransferase complex protein AlgI
VTFGALSLAALYLLLGWTAPAAVLVLATGLWLALQRPGTWPIFAVSVLFLLYKVVMEQGSVRLGVMSVSRDGLLFTVLSGLGFSYVFLRIWDLVATSRQGKVPLLDPVSLAGYLAPFHMLSAGPINAYADHVAMNRPADVPSHFDGVLAGVNDLATGLFYKFVLAEAIRIFAFGVNTPMRASSWLDTALVLIYVFFDFAGYSRVAVAIGRLSAIPTPVNFSAPFASSTLTEFWTRWHMSLGAFVRRNLYLPVQLHLVRTYGLRWAHVVTVLSLVLSFAFVGLWHRLSIRFLLWGAGMGLVLALEKLIRDHARARYAWARSRAVTRGLAILGPAYVFAILTTSLRLVVSELLGR